MTVSELRDDDGWGFSAADEAALADVCADARLAGMIPGTVRFARAILAAGYRRVAEPSPAREPVGWWAACAEQRGPGGCTEAHEHLRDDLGVWRYRLPEEHPAYGYARGAGGGGGADVPSGA